MPELVKRRHFSTRHLVQQRAEMPIKAISVQQMDEIHFLRCGNTRNLVHPLGVIRPFPQVIASLREKALIRLIINPFRQKGDYFEFFR